MRVQHSEVKGLIKLETVPEPSNDANDNNMVKQRGMLSENASKAEYFLQMKQY